jgi:hypothetical protein
MLLAVCFSASAQTEAFTPDRLHHGLTATNHMDRVETANRKGSKRMGGFNSKGKGGKYVGGRPGKK